MTNPYITQVEKMVSSCDINEKWHSVDEAKRYVANIQQLQREIRLLKSDITIAKQQVHSSYTDK